MITNFTAFTLEDIRRIATSLLSLALSMLLLMLFIYLLLRTFVLGVVKRETHVIKDLLFRRLPLRYKLNIILVIFEGLVSLVLIVLGYMAWQMFMIALLTHWFMIYYFYTGFRRREFSAGRR